jgi:glycine/D-amino acid oxidase-like deaminating enzyme
MRLIVVGSGVVGSACAYAASALGASVILVDSDRQGRATAAGAGIISPWSSMVDDPDWYVMACSAARAYPGLVEALAEAGELDLGYRQVGATRETGSGFDYRATPGGVAEVLNQALAVAPGLASGTYLETRIGFRPIGPDIKPLLGAVPGVEGLIVATGLGASGLTMGPYAGELAARLALGMSLSLDLSPFSPATSGAS